MSKFVAIVFTLKGEAAICSIGTGINFSGQQNLKGRSHNHTAKDCFVSTEKKLGTFETTFKTLAFWLILSSPTPLPNLGLAIR